MNGLLAIPGFLVASALLFALPEPSFSDDASPDVERADAESRKQFIADRLDQVRLSLAEDPDVALERTDHSLLSYSNPTIVQNLTIGATVLWLLDRRPVAAASYSMREGNGVWREFTSLTGRKLICQSDGQTIWSPDSAGMVEQPLTDAPEPSVQANLRLLQMRRLAERFAARRKYLEDVEILRLLPQPIYRFSSPKANVLDGAVFAFVQGTDPEVLLVLEAIRRNGEGAPRWQYTLARMSSTELTATLDGVEIWRTENYWLNPRHPALEYLERKDSLYNRQ